MEETHKKSELLTEERGAMGECRTRCLVRMVKGVDSGLVVVIAILIFLMAVLMTTFLYVKYEWCHVLFRNNTENPNCIKVDSKDNILLVATT